MLGSSSLHLTGAQVTGNTTHYRGGGIGWNSSGSATISGSTIDTNHAPGDSGGGLADDGSGPLEISGSAIRDNTARAGGGLTTGGAIHITGTIHIAGIIRIEAAT